MVAPKYADTEGLVRQLLLDDGLVGANVWFSVPETGLAFPGILISRVGGPVSFALDLARIQFDIFASTKHEANRVAMLLTALLEDLRPQQGNQLTGATVESVFPQGQQSDPYRRAVVDAFVYARALR